MGTSISTTNEISLYVILKKLKAKRVDSNLPYWAINSNDIFDVVDYDSPNFLWECNDFINEVGNLVIFRPPKQESLSHPQSEKRRKGFHPELQTTHGLTAQSL